MKGMRLVLIPKNQGECREGRKLEDGGGFKDSFKRKLEEFGYFGYTERG